MQLCGDSTTAVQRVLPDEGGSIPTSPLPRFRKRDWTVAGADIDVARKLIARNHYARGASNTATYLHGLYPARWLWYAECVGIAWWIPPTRSAAEAWAGEQWEGVLSLSRLAIDGEADVPSNACSFLLAHSARRIDRDRWHTLVTYADSWQGHTGTIYRAAGWEYCGETAPEPTYVLRGQMIARKAGQRTRTHSEMIAMGAECVGRFSRARFCLRRQK